MHPGFCSECGARLNRKGWRSFLRGKICESCARRTGNAWRRPTIIATLIALTTFGIGRCMRPAPPPLIIQRLANSPLSDLPVNQNDAAIANARNENSDRRPVTISTAAPDEAVYICGARTRKGTPCHRHVHFAGERCFQHKGMAAMVPVEQLKITPAKVK